MKDSKMSVFATRLKHLRQLKSKTQADCAKAFNVTAVAYGAWERGEREPSIEKIVQICQYFNTSSDWLLGVKIDTDKEQADLKRYREAVEQFDLLRDRLRALIGDT